MSLVVWVIQWQTACTMVAHTGHLDKVTIKNVVSAVPLMQLFTSIKLQILYQRVWCLEHGPGSQLQKWQKFYVLHKGHQRSCEDGMATALHQQLKSTAARTGGFSCLASLLLYNGCRYTCIALIKTYCLHAIQQCLLWSDVPVCLSPTVITVGIIHLQSSTALLCKLTQGHQ